MRAKHGKFIIVREKVIIKNKTERVKTHLGLDKKSYKQGEINDLF